ncbi:hypothetical protein PQR64_26650 [Paraburkholderia phytofirmans]|uniref:hypothetical protein n=1 Tax=Paraburkholderia phytofirmans TaxID=261302 RepID=UPI0038B6EEE6
MQTTEAKELREVWGDKPCEHVELTKEYGLGMATGDYVCTQCGKADWGNAWNKPNRPIGPQG